MKRHVKDNYEKKRRYLRERRGFTLAELLVVVAILGVLGAVAFVAVARYQRSMGQLERDAIAKQIFVAAQNHLSAMKGEGYLGKNSFGVEEDDDLYYFVVNHKTVYENGDDAFELMLPFGSIDETIRAGGNYIIRYYRDAGVVKDVFYCSASGTPAQFNHDFTDRDYPEIFTTHVGADNKNARRTYYVDNSILGWYGGAEAEALQYVALERPEIEVVNAERLYVVVKNKISNDFSDTTLRLLIKGESSGTEHYLNINITNRKINGAYYEYAPLILDDITEQALHFCNRRYDDMAAGTTGNGFIPGENIIIQAMVDRTPSDNTVYVPAYSTKKTENSLFASTSDTDGNKKIETAYIANIRHLENLDDTVSKLASSVNCDKTKIEFTSAVQRANLSPEQSVVRNGTSVKADLSWAGFKKAINAGTPEGVRIYRANGQQTGAGMFLPVSLGAVTSYEGGSQSITGIKADGKLYQSDEQKADAGLFDVLNGHTVQNLELVDFTVTGTTNAGALAGSAADTTVRNVLAHNKSKTGAAADVTSTGGSAGGLIGSVTGGSVSYSAAALTVSGSTSAGGLIGSVTGTATVSGCYSGGHTKNGNYKDWVAANSYDVTGATAGGLIGSFTGTKIENSYSTCSVSGTTAGGFVGTASGEISNTYCTGLVSSGTAYIGSGSPNFKDSNQYFEAVNEVSENGTVNYKGPGNTAVTALDLDAATYQSFSGNPASWAAANPYDGILSGYYQGKYNLKSVAKLAGTQTGFVRTHYGDWPAPEIFVINN